MKIGFFFLTTKTPSPDQLAHARIEELELARNQQTTEIHAYKSAIRVLTEENTALKSHNKALKNQLHSTQQDIQKITSAHQKSIQSVQLTNQQLQKQINLLQYENYTLQGHSNLNSEFPNVEKVLVTYANLGSQKLVRFISHFYKLSPTPDEFILFLLSVTKKVREIVQEQHTGILSLLFPGPLSTLLNSSASFPRELMAHLQQHYKQITNLDSWLKTHATTLEHEFLSPSLSPAPAPSPSPTTLPPCPLPSLLLHWRQKKEFAAGLCQIVNEIHDVFWQIMLTKGLKFGENEKDEEREQYDKNMHENPFQAQDPLVILPHLIDGSSIVAKGYAYK
jgi:regulator of replication initiation timing